MNSNAGIGTFYCSRHELVFFFKSGTGKQINNFGLGNMGRYRTNVWEVEVANTFRKGRKQDLEAHPTVKPVTLVADAIRDCANRGDLILDPFSGSGTTLLEAHRTHRRSAGIELEPLYIDTAMARLTAATGLVATVSDGRTSAEVASTRGRTGRAA